MNAVLILLFLLNSVVCRDYYVGLFKKNDILIAQDTLYKERIPFRHVYAKYGRHFKCPITYISVIDRLGFGQGPRVEVVRGGLLRKYVVLRITSLYNRPVSVNIYIGCDNWRLRSKSKSTSKTTSTTTSTTTPATKHATTHATTPATAPETAQATTTAPETNPEHTTTNPEHTTTNPEHATTNPEHATTNPEHATTNPDFTTDGIMTTQDMNTNTEIAED